MLNSKQMIITLFSGIFLSILSIESDSALGQPMKFNYYTQWGSLGEGDGQFDGHNDVDFYNGRVIVADYANHRIQFFDKDGKFISKFGEGGEGDGQFHKASALSLDKDGNIYVADQFNFRIQKFTNDGKFIALGVRRGRRWSILTSTCSCK